MSTSRRKGKRHRPAPALLNPLDLLVPAPATQATVTALRFRSALDMLARHQHPGEAEWRDLADVVNLVETLALEMNQFADPGPAMALVRLATADMSAAAERFKAGQGLRLSGVGLQAMRELVDLHEECLRTLTAAAMGKAKRLTEARVIAYQTGRADGRKVVSV